MVGKSWEKASRWEFVRDIGGTALHYASWQSHLDTMTELLTAGADPNAQDKKGETPLHIAAKRGQYQACQVLVSAGASIMSRDFHNGCPIHLAIWEKHQRIVESMIKQEGSLDKRDETLRGTALRNRRSKRI